jgi:sigma-E factor negative regulatory protein RseC
VFEVLTETGRVVAVEGSTLWVETIRQSVCGTCAVQKGCGHGLLNQRRDGQRSYLSLSSKAFASEQFDVDDEVSIGVPEALLLRGSFIVYIVPLFMMLLLASLGPVLLPGQGDLGAVTGALAGLSLGALLVRLHAHYHRNTRALQPRLLGRALSGTHPGTYSQSL